MKQHDLMYIPHMGIEPLASDKAPAAKDFTSKMEGMLESIRKSKGADEAQCQQTLLSSANL